jgi:hypothetical protein
VPVKILLFILAAFQTSQVPVTVRGDRFQIAVPEGWKILNSDFDVVLEHSSGASLLLLRATPTTNLNDFAEKQAERIMTPLGFAKLGEPQHFKGANEEWVQYEIRGNRFAEHRRILYRAFRRGGSVFELVYENNEDQFEVLLTEAQEIASSLQAIIQTRQTIQPPRRPVRRR